MREGQSVGGEGFLDIGFDPRAEFRVLVRSAREPGAEIGARLGGVAPVGEPAQFLHARAVGGAGQVIEGVAHEVHVATLPQGVGNTSATAFFRPS